jgi:hypothetical protein
VRVLSADSADGNIGQKIVAAGTLGTRDRGY